MALSALQALSVAQVVCPRAPNWQIWLLRLGLCGQQWPRAFPLVSRPTVKSLRMFTPFSLAFLLAWVRLVVVFSLVNGQPCPLKNLSPCCLSVLAHLWPFRYTLFSNWADGTRPPGKRFSVRGFSFETVFLVSSSRVWAMQPESTHQTDARNRLVSSQVPEHT